MITWKQWVVWLQSILGEAFEGAADGFLCIVGGSTSTQALSSTPPTPITIKQIGISMLTLAAIYVFSYIKKNRLPTVQIQEQVKVTPPPQIQPPSS